MTDKICGKCGAPADSRWGNERQWFCKECVRRYQSERRKNIPRAREYDRWANRTLAKAHRIFANRYPAEFAKILAEVRARDPRP